MKANELRIGNWILDEDNEENQIEHLQPIYGYAYRWEWLKYYKPIPLTEEWLVKFGFISNPYNDEYFLPNKWIIDIDKTKGFLEIHWKHVEIKHVHQLQNLFFALTNEELTLKQ